ncbi:hypothetical protein, partial [Sneathia sp. DSM 16631]|uniref:hypothetical protein n=1 Tax=Sneathia sp. DSM 16631 TaxID=2777994 RepID=UPI001D00D5B2
KNKTSSLKESIKNRRNYGDSLVNIVCKSNYFPRRSFHFKNYKVILSGRGSLLSKRVLQLLEMFVL